MSTVGVSFVALVLVLVLVKGKQVRMGSLVVGVVFGLLVGATPAGPATARGIEAGASWVWAKVSQL